MSFAALASEPKKTSAPARKAASSSFAPKAGPVRTAAPPSVAQRSWALSPSGVFGPLQRQASSAAPSPTAPPVVHDVLRSSGQPMEHSTRTFFEQRFQHDFSRVRIHDDAHANSSAKAVNARAYTVGPKIIFGAGTRDRRLLGHELTHVVQQERAPSASSSLRVVDDPASERAANHASASIEKGHAVGAVNAGNQSSLQREPAAAPEDMGYLEEKLLETALSPFGFAGPLLDMLKASLVGFYTVMKTEGPTHAAEAWQRIKEAFLHPSQLASMVLHYWWGLIKGIFSPLTGLLSLGKFIVMLPDLATNLVMTAWTRRSQLAADVSRLYTRGQDLTSQAAQQFRSLTDHPLETAKLLVPWLSSLGGKATSAAADGGRAVAHKFLSETSKPLPELGEDIGEFVGTTAVNVVLLFFTAGIGDAIAQLGVRLGELAAVIGEAGEGVSMLGNVAAKLETVLITVGNWITKIEQAIAAATEALFKPIGKLMEGFGDLLGDLRLFFRDLLGASEEGVGAEAKALGDAADKTAPALHASTPHAPAAHTPSAHTSTTHAPLDHAPSAHTSAGQPAPVHTPEPHPHSPTPDHPAPVAKPPAKDVSVANRNMSREQWKAQESDRRLKEGFAKDLDEAFDKASTPKVKGGKIDNHRLPPEPRPRIDINPAPGSKDLALPLRQGETAAQALARVKKIIGKKMSDIPELETLWNKASKSVLSRNQLNASNYPDLYKYTQKAFWRGVGAKSAEGKAARAILEEAGFGFPVGRPAAQLLDAPATAAASDITISLDHLQEKAIDSNWTKALDADNLQFEFSDANSYREAIQARHPELRP